MKHLLSTILLICSVHFLAGQQFVIDSLTKMLATEVDPISRADIHLGLVRANNFANGQAEGIKNHIETALDLSRKHEYKEGEAIALVFRAQWEFNNGAVAEVMYDNIIQAIAIAQSIPSKSIETFCQYQLAEYYSYDKNDNDTAIEILTQAIAKADKTVADKHLGNCYKVLGIAYSLQGRHQLALDSYERAKSHFQRVKTHPFIQDKLGRPSAMEADFGRMNYAHVHLYIGRSYGNLGEAQKALENLNIAKEIFESDAAAQFTALVLEELGITYQKFGMLEKSIDAYQKAAKFYEATASDVDLSFLLESLGGALITQKEYAEAEIYLTRSFNLAQSRKDTSLIMKVLEGLGEVHRARGNLDQALFYIEELEKVASEHQYPLLYAAIHIHFGNILFEQKKYTASLQRAHQALKWSAHSNHSADYFNSYSLLASNYIITTQYDSATHYLILADSIAQQMDVTSSKIALWKSYTELYEKQGDYKNALAAHKNYFKLHNAFYTDKAQSKLKEEQVRQDVVGMQKEKELAEREASLLAQRNRSYLITAIALLAILLIGAYLFNQLRKTKRQIEAQNRLLQQLNATKDKFFGIIAHDIRSPIVALDGVGEQMEYYLKKNNTEKLNRLASRVDSTAKRLSALLDNLLNWALLQQGVIPYHPKSLNVRTVGEEILQMFQNNAEAKGVRLDVQIEEGHQVFADEPALNTILRNLVSNAIKFTPKGGQVTLSTESNNDQVLINVNDTGIGISAEHQSRLFSLDRTSKKGTAGEKGTGLGLTLVKELAELNKGTIEVSNLKKGSRFILGLPAPG